MWRDDKDVEHKSFAARRDPKDLIIRRGIVFAGWWTITSTAQQPRTMPSPFSLIDVHTAQRPLFLGFDVGGTSIKLGVVDDLGRPIANTKIVTEEDRGPRDAVK